MFPKTFTLLFSFVVAAVTAGALPQGTSISPSTDAFNSAAFSQIYSAVPSQAPSDVPSQVSSSALAPTASSAGLQAADEVYMSSIPKHGALLIARSQSVCDTSAAAPFLRAYSSYYENHFYSADYNEMHVFVTNETYASQGNAGLLFREPTVSTVRLYRVVNPYSVSRYYTTNRDDADSAIINDEYTTEGIAGYVYTSQICGSIPLYHASLSTKDSFYTTDESELENAVKNGYTDEGIACYVLPTL